MVRRCGPSSTSCCAGGTPKTSTNCHRRPRDWSPPCWRAAMSESTPPTSEEPSQTAPDATAAAAHGTRPAASGGPAPAPDDPDASTVDYGRPFTVEFDPTGEEPPVIDPSELAALEDRKSVVEGKRVELSGRSRIGEDRTVG